MNTTINNNESSVDFIGPVNKALNADAWNADLYYAALLKLAGYNFIGPVAGMPEALYNANAFAMANNGLSALVSTPEYQAAILHSSIPDDTPGWTPELYPMPVWHDDVYAAAYALFHSPQVYNAAPRGAYSVEEIKALKDSFLSSTMDSSIHNADHTAIAKAGHNPATLSYIKWGDFREFYPSPEFKADVLQDIEDMHLNWSFMPASSACIGTIGTNETSSVIF